MIDVKLQYHALLALAAAALFGMSTPLAKLLLGELPPVALAGLLYLGSGLGLVAVRLLRRAGTGAPVAREAPLTRHDLPWLLGAVAAGGVIAPVLLLWGLRGADAAAASLLLNLEGVLTTLLAAVLFREAVGGRIWAASLLMAAGGALLSWQPGTGGWSPQSLAIAGACLFWGLDNNLTRKVSAGDPLTVAMIKGLAAGTINLALALGMGLAWPPAGVLAAALLLGFVAYGVSLVLFIHALRHLGSARATAHFMTAPFIGAGVAVLALGEPLTGLFVLALLIMAAATWLVLSEQHAHAHVHEAEAHNHRHEHDAHHQHEHAGDEGPAPHAHWHQHAPLTHAHPHLPDLHHRHRH